MKRIIKGSFQVFFFILFFSCSRRTLAQDFVTNSAIKDRVRSSSAAWNRSVPSEHPRLFFTKDEYNNLRSRYNNSQGRERVLFDSVLQYVNQLTAKKVRAYRTPQQLVTATNPMASAQAELWQRPIGDDIVALSFALLLKDDAAVRAKLRETVVTVCKFPTWGVQERQVQLATASLARAVAIAYDWHNAMWTTDEKQLILQAVRTHVNEIATGLTGQADWAAHYQENHNHVAVAAMGICGAAFLREIPEAEQWIGGAQLNFEKVGNNMNEDGSTNEGVAYWSYSLAYILQYIEGTKNILGTANMYQAPFLKNAISFRLNTSTSGFGSILPWGDVSYNGYGPHFILYKLASVYNDSRGQYMADSMPYNTSNAAGGLVWTALWYNPVIKDVPPANMDYHANSLDVVTTRSGWTAQDYLLSVKSGIASASHSHLDIGAIALAFGDEWLLTTSGYGKGKSEGLSFWKRSAAENGRWDFRSNATESQSTLLINGVNQVSNSKSRGSIDEFVSTPEACWTGVDLTQAYSGVTYARREVLHSRGQYILVFDNIKAPQPITVGWLAQVPGNAATSPGASLNVKSSTGASLVITPVSPVANFVVYVPKSKKDDLPEGRLKTYALNTKGKNISDVVALLPVKAGEVSHVKNIKSAPSGKGFEVTVEGDTWVDHITITDRAAVLVRTENGINKTLLKVARHRIFVSNE